MVGEMTRLGPAILRQAIERQAGEDLTFVPHWVNEAGQGRARFPRPRQNRDIARLSEDYPS